MARNLAAHGSSTDFSAGADLARLPQFIFAGETNAGKSSVINHLLKVKNMARTSSAQAKTRQIDRFLVNDAALFVDTPGIPGIDEQYMKEWNKAFLPSIEAALPSVHRGCLIFVHDSMRQTTLTEIEYFHFLCTLTQLPPLLVLSKDDKITSHEQRIRRTARIREAFDLPEFVPHVHYSIHSALSASRTARRTVLRYVEGVATAGEGEDLFNVVRLRKHA